MNAETKPRRRWKQRKADYLAAIESMQAERNAAEVGRCEALADAFVLRVETERLRQLADGFWNGWTATLATVAALAGRKDLIPALRQKKTAPFMDTMRQMRGEGSTYRAIADATGLSIGGVWKSLNRE
jgi:hypothetical protein